MERDLKAIYSMACQYIAALCVMHAFNVKRIGAGTDSMVAYRLCSLMLLQ